MYPGIKISCRWQEEGPWALWQQAQSLPRAALRKAGIRAVEFALWHRPHALRYTAEEEVALVWEEARRCVDEGLRVHLHPYVHIDHRGPAHMTEATRGPVVEHMERVIALAARILEAQQAPMALVYHPAEAALPAGWNPRTPPDTWRRELQHRSLAFFDQLRKFVAPFDGSLVVTCETQLSTNERKVRIGDRPGELTDLAAESGCRICWDTGHFLKSAGTLGFDPEPPPPFLARLGHVHLHAVVNGKDHFPATPDNTYLQRCLQLMRTGRFSGCVTLEYSILRLPDPAPELMQALLEDAVAMIRFQDGNVPGLPVEQALQPDSNRAQIADTLPQGTWRDGASRQRPGPGMARHLLL